MDKESGTHKVGPSPKLIADLRAAGLHEQADKLAKQLINGSKQPGGVKGYTKTEDYLSRFITQDKKMNRVKAKVRKLAGEEDCVLIQGPTGTGKELLAQALHGNRTGQFVDINCAGMPENLIESELFGHVRGAFTGAHIDRQGLLEVAANGTIFMDEIGELKNDLQAKLLRVIQEKIIRRVGGKTNTPITCRFVFATKHRLLSRVKEGKFRDDFYARISTFQLETTSLEERLEDIPIIIRALSEKDFPTDKINWAAINLDMNVRTLQQIIRRYEVLGELPMFTDLE